jgi:membrane protein required for colicin V production
MQTYDIVMLVILAVATLTGAIKGLVWQVASLASLIASYLVAFKYGQVVAGWIPAGRPWNVIFAMLGLFVVTAAAIWFVCQLIHDWLDRVKLKSFDRQIGALLGLLKGVIFCILLTGVAVTFFGPTVRGAVARSQAGHVIGRVLDRSADFLPEEMNEVLEPFVELVNRQLRQGEEAVQWRAILRAERRLATLPQRELSTGWSAAGPRAVNGCHCRRRPRATGRDSNGLKGSISRETGTSNRT